MTDGLPSASTHRTYRVLCTAASSARSTLRHASPAAAHTVSSSTKTAIPISSSSSSMLQRRSASLVHLLVIKQLLLDRPLQGIAPTRSPSLPLFTQFSVVSDIAIFALKRDVKLQLTNAVFRSHTHTHTHTHTCWTGAS